MRFLLLLVLAVTSLSAASAPAMGWLPLPAGGITWPTDHVTPAGAGLVGRATAIVVMDWQQESDGGGQKTFWALRGWWNDHGRPVDFRQVGMMLTVNGAMPAQTAGKPDLFIKGQDASGGLLRALGGDASSVVMLVDADGRVAHILRCTDGYSFTKEFDSVQPTEDRGLIVNEANFPPACRPALDLFRLADVKAALALCKAKLGADGAAMAKTVTARADAMIDQELAVLADATAPASRRFLARGRIADIQAAVPGAGKGEAAKAVKALKGDKAYAAEEDGWEALQDYLAQAGKTPAKKWPEVQKQLLDRITTKHGGTYAAELAALIRKASRIDP